VRWVDGVGVDDWGEVAARSVGPYAGGCRGVRGGGGGWTQGECAGFGVAAGGGRGALCAASLFVRGGRGVGLGEHGAGEVSRVLRWWGREARFIPHTAAVHKVEV